MFALTADGKTVKVALFEVVPPGPVQVNVNVVVELTPVAELEAINPIG